MSLTEEEVQFTIRTSVVAEWACDICGERCQGLHAVWLHITDAHGEGTATEMEKVN